MVSLNIIPNQGITFKACRLAIGGWHSHYTQSPNCSLRERFQYRHDCEEYPQAEWKQTATNIGEREKGNDQKRQTHQLEFYMVNWQII